MIADVFQRSDGSQYVLHHSIHCSILGVRAIEELTGMRRVFRVRLNPQKTAKRQGRAITLPTHVAVQRLKGRGF